MPSLSFTTSLFFQHTAVLSSGVVVVPYAIATSALESFLSHFRGLSLLTSDDDLSSDAFDCRQSLRFSEVVAALAENIVVDFPSFTSRILSILCRLLSVRSKLLSFHVVAAVAFAAQLVKTETGVDVGLIDAAVDVLVANHQNDEPNVRIICLQV